VGDFHNITRSIDHQHAMWCAQATCAALALAVGCVQAADPGDVVLIGAHYFGGW
jgi:hypothetical protein